MTDPWLQLRAAIDVLGSEPDPAFEGRVRIYLDELDRWSRVARLTGHRSEAERIRHLIIDSLLFLAAIPEPAAPLLDIGTGAGVPGLILKLARPGWPVTLLDSSRRRANFLRHVVRRLGLEAAEVREGRAEALARDLELVRAFRTVTTRAVGAPELAAKLAAPFLQEVGRTVISLGPGPPPSGGTVRRVAIVHENAGLRIHRAFLIIPAAANRPDVPRETRGARGPRSERGQSERRGREDDDSGQPGRGAGRRRAADPPR